MPKYEKEYVQVSIKLPKDMLDRIKTIADKYDVAYINIIKMALSEWLDKHKD